MLRQTEQRKIPPLIIALGLVACSGDGEQTDGASSSDEMDEASTPGTGSGGEPAGDADSSGGASGNPGGSTAIPDRGGSGAQTTGSGGSETSGSGGSGSSTGGCAENDRVACDDLVAFEGEHTVDGDGEEFCDIPGYRLDLGAGKEAIIKLAWSSEGLHLHAIVEDDTIIPANPAYLGDNVQLFYTTHKPTKGYPYGEFQGGTQVLMTAPFLHETSTIAAEVILPHQHGAEYESREIEGGYEMELFWPWSPAPSEDGPLPLPVAGDSIGYNFMVGIKDLEEMKVDVPLHVGELAGCGELYCETSMWCEGELL